MNKIWTWFTSTVFKENNSKNVIKNRNNWKPYSNDIVEIQDEYKKYFWNIEWIHIIPVYLSEGNMILTQEFINWEFIDLLTTTNEKVFELLEAWNNMEDAENILFDIFWLEWLIRLFMFFNKDNIIWKSKNTIDPSAQFLLNLLFKFPKEEYQKISHSEELVFISKNIIENTEWELHLIDLEKRNLSNPLNKLWHVYTKKAIKFVQENNPEYKKYLETKIK
jgi:hypothetical protein